MQNKNEKNEFVCTNDFSKNLNNFYFILSNVPIADHHTVYSKITEVIVIIVEKLILLCLD